MGLHHRLVTLDGEDVIECEPILSYLHRGWKKNYSKPNNYAIFACVKRRDYLATMFIETITINALEQLQYPR